MKVELNNKTIQIDIQHEKYDRCFDLKAMTPDNKLAGSLSFEIFAHIPSKVWLSLIKVNKEYAHQGYGHALIDCFEFVCYELRIKEVEGKYFPDNKYALPFYKKHGYNIFKDGYETLVTKTISPKEVSTNIKPRISEFDQVETIWEEEICDLI